MTTLVTGGSGYIGSHVVRLLRESGQDVVVVDDFVSGRRERIAEVPNRTIDLASDTAADLIRRVAIEFDVDEVVHFAARKQVAESVARPAWYYAQNVGGMANLLQGIDGTAVRRVLFSSSAAVYGDVQTGTVGEDAVAKPVNPYGSTKLVGEELLAAAAAAQRISATSLRYFNVAGAGWPELGDRAVLNLIPMVFERIAQGIPPQIFGDGYPTPDGTCVRDYIHVMDLANAHLVALSELRDRSGGHEVFNVGTGRGTSVREMIKAIGDASGIAIEPVIEAPRPGDPASVVAKVDRIRTRLGWTSRFSVANMVSSAWDAHVRAQGMRTQND